MPPDNGHLIVVFPISATAFGLRADWFELYAARLMHPSFFLMTLLLVVAIGVLALRRFENADLHKKVWNLPVLIGAMVVWPSIVLGIKNLVDAFDTFLILNVFGIPWRGFGFPEITSWTNVAEWPAEALARLLPNLAYWVIYAFFMIFFFFYTVLGPMILAKGVLYDEIEGFFALGKELINLLLWQTTLVVLVAFIMPDIVSGKPFPAQPESNFYFLSLILGLLIFFVPTLTRKFAGHIEANFFPMGFRWGGAMLGLTALGKVGGTALTTAGLPEGTETAKAWRQRLLKGEEFHSRYDQRRQIRDLHHEKDELEQKLHEDYEQARKARETVQEAQKQREESLIALAKKAKEEMKRDESEEE